MLRKHPTLTPSKKAITDIAGFDDIQKELSAFLTNLFDILLPVALFFGGTALTASMYRSLHYGWYPTPFLNVGMYATAVVILIVRRRLPPLSSFQ